ncbi:hypothetical protein [Acinetobacter seifertii]|uniref:Uncharacterized protein n=1 Tax=Acinetobacter seifertii TaxID=1530123 RepID=A0ABX8L9Z7_9GAMM|nr:hypothetical protein [Acinetobacter seifertii]QXB47678.1 hypothetical protein I6L30_06670 [Acinetobacter seifertii]
MKICSKVRNRKEALEGMALIENKALENNGRVALSDSIRYQWLALVAASYGAEECQFKSKDLAKGASHE